MITIAGASLLTHMRQLMLGSSLSHARAQGVKLLVHVQCEDISFDVNITLYNVIFELI